LAGKVRHVRPHSLSALAIGCEQVINPRSLNNRAVKRYLLIVTFPVKDGKYLNQGELEVIGERPSAKPKYSIATISKGSQVNAFFIYIVTQAESLAFLIMLLKGYRFTIPNNQPDPKRNCIQCRNGDPQEELKQRFGVDYFDRYP
jgi:hypothetical protein